MAWSPGETIDVVIAQARHLLDHVQIIDYDLDEQRALIKLEGQWAGYRIFVSEVYRSNETVRYAYYVLSEDNRHIHRFDNSGDRLAIQLKYGADWKGHQHEEIPHQHDVNRKVTLTPAPMTFETFVEWLINNL